MAPPRAQSTPIWTPEPTPIMSPEPTPIMTPEPESTFTTPANEIKIIDFTLSGDDDAVGIYFKGTGHRLGVVVSRASMCEASTVWREWFNQTTTTKGPSQYMLLDQSTKNALLLILRLVHYRHEGLPTMADLSLDDLRDLAFLSNKYKVVHVVKPFLVHRDWTSIYKPNNWTLRDHRAWLYITQTFGYMESQDISARYLVTSISLDENRLAGFQSGEMKHEIEQEMDLVNRILKVRAQTIAAIAKACHQMVIDLQDGGNCAINQQNPSCNITTLGSFVQWLIKMGLYTSDGPSETSRFSIDHLQAGIRDFDRSYPKYVSHNYDGVVEYCNMTWRRRVMDAWELGMAFAQPHTDCTRAADDLLDKVTAIIADMPSPMREMEMGNVGGAAES
ncbi:hypothetical protein CC86DRAFT_368081 [Ophiobolus disseminans]|uniref:BTB domain-containing protein n=1 Tax=Ophiobolus disseminans TaxID=1469910 RepID=A0A6A7AC11_9PLEO|nr:hypothetical protein CC86DRAFT_368081 [Ophiobolus disseminans]